MAARSKACGTVTVGGRAQSLVSNPPLHVGQQAITTPLVLCLQMCLTQLLPPIVFLTNLQGTPLWALHCGIYLKPLQGQVWCPKCNYYMNYDANLFLISLTHTCTHTHTYHPGKLFNVHHRLWPGLHFCCCSVQFISPAPQNSKQQFTSMFSKMMPRRHWSLLAQFFYCVQKQPSATNKKCNEV